ncbi:hypothetical protein BH10BAC5_BH10BAC5_01100 [soil metagenome]
MKKITSFLLLTIALFIFKTASAQLHFVEDFNYPVGDSIGDHGWIYNSGNGVNPIRVITPGLSFTGYGSSNIGNGCRLLANGDDGFKPFTINDSTESVYTSFMVRVDTARTGDYFFAMLPYTSQTLYAARTYVKDSLGFIAFGISKGTAASGQGYTPAIYLPGVTYLLVIKYTFNTATSNDDDVSLFVFSGTVPVVEPPTPTVGPVASTASDYANLGRVAFRQGSASSSPTLQIDGVRVSKSWSNIATGIVNNSTVASSFVLSQNYPNPFNPTTKISFALPVNGNVTLKVYNAIGKEVSNLVNSRMNSGSYTVDFNGSNLNSGVYFYSLELAGENGQFYSEQKKLMLVK